MKIKINDKIICFPPYISTTWEHVRSLQVESDPISRSEFLVITLTDGARVKIPHLDPKIVEAIFTAHLKFVEQLPLPGELQRPATPLASFILPASESGASSPFKFGVSGLDGLGTALQHNPAQSDLPDLPEEILGKIAAIAKIVGQEESLNLPQPIEGCNCLHCQLSKAIQKAVNPQLEEVIEEEEVSEEDLRFRLWDIIQNGEKLYTVTNPLDSQEQYSVYLGEPIGCTCGTANCEHVQAVLRS